MRKDHRRRFLCASGALIAAPLASFAQPAPKVRRIGVLSPDSANSVFGQELRKRFPDALRPLGYEEGKNLVIEWRWGEGKPDTLPALSEELVRLNVELIVARTNGPTAAAMRATRSIPIVMLSGAYPVELGFIQSLARPGGNVTGTTYFSGGLVGKQLQMLKEIAPNLVRVAILWNANSRRDSGFGKVTADSIERVTALLGMTPLFFEVSGPDEIKAVLDKIASSRIDALYYLGDPIFRQNVEEITAFARKRKLASVGIAGLAFHGGLIEYSPDFGNLLARTASYVDRILKGAKPADLPVEEPAKFNLVINLKTANALGLTIPQSVLLLADRVIE